jgi:hypothetical protein
MNMHHLTWTCAGALALSAGGAGAQEWLDRTSDALHYQTPGGLFRADLSGTVDVEAYYIDQRPPGLLFGNTDFVNPRLSLWLDTRLGPHLYSLVQFRFDRGFDPRAKVRDARFDEYLLRYTPFKAPVVNLQIGKFATVFGNWVQRHDTWSNPLITAPLAYEHFTTAGDLAIAPTAAAFQVRRSVPDSKGTWLPVVWGPAYTSGGSIFGQVERLDYAFEVKNASISSRPTVWDAQDLGFENPTVTGRIGYRPNAAWNVGASVSHGAYLLPPVIPALPAGQGLDSFNQTTIGTDVSFAWHHWQIWGEAMASRFEIPNVGPADTLTYFVEAKYKFSARLFGALRWNQQFFDDVPDGAGGRAPWDNDVWRIDTALGFRFNRHWQGKVQYSYSHQKGSLQQGEQLVAGQVTLKF